MAASLVQRLTSSFLAAVNQTPRRCGLMVIGGKTREDRSRVSSTSSESLSDGQMTCGGCCFYCAKRREEEENVGSLSNQLWNEKGIAFFSMPLLKPSTTRRNILLLTLCYVLFYTYTKLASKLWRVACGYGIALQASYYRHSAWSWMAVYHYY